MVQQHRQQLVFPLPRGLVQCGRLPEQLIGDRSFAVGCRVGSPEGAGAWPVENLLVDLLMHLGDTQR